MSFAYDLSAPEFSAPELNAPQPCKHAANCYYNGTNGCAFVHPGEEGKGMKIFPARIIKDSYTGKETWQKGIVRLIGGADFYERRRLKMSWPEWCNLPKNSHLQKPVVKSAQQSVATIGTETAPLSFSQLGPMEKWQAMFQKGYAIETPEITAARIAFIASLQTNEKNIQEINYQQMGNALYAIIEPFIKENKEAMKEGGVWHDNITVGKITGMLLEGISYEELYPMLTDMEELKETIADCCVSIKDAAEADAIMV